MKTFIFIILISLSGEMIAQTDSLSKLNKQTDLQLQLQKAKNTISTGQAMFGFGVIVTAVGLRTNVSSTVITISSIAALVGIPVWIGGVSRKNDIQVQLMSITSDNSIGLGLKIRF